MIVKSLVNAIAELAADEARADQRSRDCENELRRAKVRINELEGELTAARSAIARAGGGQ